MKESWRWYGPLDRITLPEIAQTGATGIVTALHEIAYGEVWPRAAIAARKAMIESNSALGLTWNVVESLPVHESIKRGEGDLETLFANYRQSLANLAAEGVHTICYNFMPLLDWTRTDLTWALPRGGSALRFSAPKMAAFELFMLGRAGAESDYPDDAIRAARVWYQASSEDDRKGLLSSIMSGLPGAFPRYSLDELREVLKTYEGLSRDDLRANYKRFLDAVIPTCEELGMRMCVHPDDPPRNILGLPRIVSSDDDIDWILRAHDAPANGLTLCSGSLGANPVNDVPAIAARHAERVHFAHLRNVHKEPDGSFFEDEHLTGDTDMVALIAVLLGEEKRRQSEGRADWQIPFRPDHGHELLDDASRKTHPGYPLVGRMRGLAELRGVAAALSHSS